MKKLTEHELARAEALVNRWQAYADHVDAPYRTYIQPFQVADIGLLLRYVKELQQRIKLDESL